MELGINSFFLDVEESYKLGLKRVEIVSHSKEKALSDLKEITDRALNLSIHLPVFMPEYFSYGQWDVFLCDTAPDKRELSFSMLEDNLAFVKDVTCEYVVSHFGGFYERVSSSERLSYPNIVEDSLNRIIELSYKYNKKILLEYFGLNKNLFLPEEWLSLIRRDDNIGLLLDTGHLYFSCCYNNLDFYDTLEKLAPHASAFHIWNTKGREHYIKYHHVAPHSSQKEEDGWAFTTNKLVTRLSSLNPNAPLIIEPNILYGGKEYIINSITCMQKILQALE